VIVSKNIRKKKLKNVVIVEQDLATNTEPGGEKLKRIRTNDLTNLCNTLDPLDRMRLVLIFYACGNHPNEFRTFLDSLNLTAKEQTIYEEFIRLKESNSKDKHFRPPPHDYVFDESRFEPALVQIVKDAMSGTLTQDEFPYSNSSDRPSIDKKNRNRNAFKKKKKRKRLQCIFLFWVE